MGKDYKPEAWSVWGVFPVPISRPPVELNIHLIPRREEEVVAKGQALESDCLESALPPGHLQLQAAEMGFRALSLSLLICKMGIKKSTDLTMCL